MQLVDSYLHLHQAGLLAKIPTKHKTWQNDSRHSFAPLFLFMATSKCLKTLKKKTVHIHDAMTPVKCFYLYVRTQLSLIYLQTHVVSLAQQPNLATKAAPCGKTSRSRGYPAWQSSPLKTEVTYSTNKTGFTYAASTPPKKTGSESFAHWSYSQSGCQRQKWSMRKYSHSRRFHSHSWHRVREPINVLHLELVLHLESHCLTAPRCAR